MRLWIFSDLHVDVCEWAPPDPRPEHDVVVVAGDVRDRLCERVLGEATPVVYVPGNHDFWRTNLTTEKAKAREAAARAGITLLLDGDTAVVGNVRFVGGTLWTDYQLGGESSAAQSASAREMNDHKRIRHGSSYHKWWTTDASLEHAKTKSRIEAALAIPHDGPTVVVTHHPPHERSLYHGERRELIDAAYASDLSSLMTGSTAPDLWIHGHVHVKRDYVVGRTRIVANPRGYVTHTLRSQSGRSRIEVENPDFDAGLTLTI